MCPQTCMQAFLHSFIFHCHQPSLIPDFGSYTHLLSIPLLEGTFLFILQPNFTCPQTCMQAFKNPTQFHLLLSSTESNPRVWKPHPLLLSIPLPLALATMVSPILFSTTIAGRGQIRSWSFYFILLKLVLATSTYSEPKTYKSQQDKTALF